MNKIKIKQKVMNAKDLMIGDRVRIIEPDRYHGAICRIVSLINHKDDECAYFKVFILTKGNLLHEVCNENIEPIPITNEILEKNGWKIGMYSRFNLEDGKRLDFYHHENRLREWWEGIDEWQNNAKVKEIIFQCHCTYVHELQNALRLCGLNNLSESSKFSKS